MNEVRQPRSLMLEQNTDFLIGGARGIHTERIRRIRDQAISEEISHIIGHPLGLPRAIIARKMKLAPMLCDEDKRGVLLVEATAVRNLKNTCIEVCGKLRDRIASKLATAIIIDPHYAHSRIRGENPNVNCTGTTPVNSRVVFPDGPAKLIEAVRQMQQVEMIIAPDDELEDAVSDYLERVSTGVIPFYSQS